jgi:hypothetical protein
MMGGGGVWSAVGDIGAAALSAAGLVVAGVVAARSTASAARTTREAEQAVRTGRAGDCEALVRALARSYDELRLWVANPVGEPPEPPERARRYFETGL